MTDSTGFEIKKTCLFRFRVHTEASNQTIGEILSFFEQRKITLFEFHFQQDSSATAKVQVCCRIEKDRIPRTAALLEKVSGVSSLQRLEEK